MKTDTFRKLHVGQIIDFWIMADEYNYSYISNERTTDDDIEYYQDKQFVITRLTPQKIYVEMI